MRLIFDSTNQVKSLLPKRTLTIIPNYTNLSLKLFTFFYIIVSFFASNQIGTYADSWIDNEFTKYNLGSLLQIQSWTKTFDASYESTISSYGYSVATPLLIIVWSFSKLILIENWMQSPLSIFIQNFMVSLVSLLGFFALLKWSTLVLHKKASKMIFLLPAIIPIWYGNSFMNLKDIPIFTGFAALIYITALIFDQTTQIKKKTIIFWVSISIIFTVGVRPAMSALIFPTIIFHLIWQKKQNKKIGKVYSLGVFLSLSYVLFTNYFLFQNPWSYFLNSFSTGAKFGWTGSVLSWGSMYQSPAIPRTYLIQMLSAQTPLAVIILIVLALLVFSFTIKNLREKVPTSVSLAAFLFFIVLISTLIFRPVLYDNARQLLFIWVFVCVVALWSLDYLLFGGEKRNFLRLIISLLMFVCIIDQIKLFPYNYIYRNEIARLAPAGSFETDYWGISGKELTKWVIQDAKSSNIKNETFAFIFPQSYVPYTRDVNLKPVPTQDLSAKYYSQIWRPGLLPDFSAQCPIEFAVTREVLFGKNEILGYVRKC
jgi:hypothetical protein